MIKLFCVGIYFYQDVPFKEDPKNPTYMRGGDILVEAAALGLRYQINSTGHVEFLSYTPKPGDPRRHPTATVIPGVVFPFNGLPLSLSEIRTPLGQPSQIFQFTSEPPPQQQLDALPSPQFRDTLFKDGSLIRIRLLSIYDSTGIYSA